MFKKITSSFLLILSSISAPLTVLADATSGQKISTAPLSNLPYSSSQCILPKEKIDYRFAVSDTLLEAGSAEESTSPYFWLNSGAAMKIEKGIGRTVFGSVPKDSYWYNRYKSANSRDTDGGFHPQNIFRLLTRSYWKNFTEEFSFKITRVNLSNSPERNAWSGVLMFLRYKDSDNLYYAGLRMDGYAVVKKKINGTYFTLAEKKVFEGTYNRNTNPNLIPIDSWIGIKSEILTLTDGVVLIRFFISRENNGKWEYVLEARDGGSKFGAPHSDYGLAGIRTDYMDISFDNLSLSSRY